MRALVLALLMAAVPLAARAELDSYTELARGRELARVGDCVACHTAPGGKPFAGGLRLATPFGDIATPNLTPDEETGLGRWTADEFARALHDGIGRNGMRLYPAFPYPYYTKVTRRDADAILTFLRSLTPVRNAVPRDTLPFPYDIRLAMAGWNMLFFKPGEFTPDPARSAEYNRGAYLVEGLGHCGACHTPMNQFGANDAGAFLQGNRLQGWFAPNITSDARLGLGAWSIDEIVTYLQTGRNARTQASGPMAEVITNSTALMRPEELRAMAIYLKERPAPATPAPAPLPANDPRMVSGAALFIDNCTACHTRTGEGVALMFPRLAGSQIVQQGDPTTLLRVVLQGTRGAATSGAPTAPAMPSFAWRLSDTQAADVVTYIRNSWGNAAPPATESDAVHGRAP